MKAKLAVRFTEGILLGIAMLSVVEFARAQDSEVNKTGKKRAVTVEDAIKMTQLSGELSGGTAAHPAIFSADGKKFLLVLKKGNLVRGTNDFRIALYRSAEALDRAKPEILVTMSSSSNREAIRGVRWLPDNDTFVFLGENPGQPTQVYRFRLQRHELRRLTNHPTPILNFDITTNGRNLVYEAERPVATLPNPDFRFKSIVVDGQTLSDLMAGKLERNFGPCVFLQKAGQSRVAVPFLGENFFVESVRIAPNGRYVLLQAAVREAPSDWRHYKDEEMQRYFSTNRVPGAIYYFSPRLDFIFDSATRTLRELINSPAVGPAHWARDSSSVFVETYQDAVSLNNTENDDDPVRAQVSLPHLERKTIGEREWPREVEKEKPPVIDVQVEQDLNTPPKIVVSDPATGRRKILIELNPEFHDLEFGRVEIVEWTACGAAVQGGLYLPPDYTPRKRYPLVIQTHGFHPDAFSMNGISEWASAYAARPLAARGVIVLQAFAFKNVRDEDHFNDDGRCGSTRMQAFRNMNAEAYENAIDLLSAKGIVDPQRVGIVGFSRSVSNVSYLLTHTKYPFAAAYLVDGVDSGYFQEIAYPAIAWDMDELNGGAAPFGSGLSGWIRDSPSFALDRVSSPIRLLALRPSGILLQWEWYAGLVLQKKPVEMTFLTDEEDGDNHLLSKPWERRIAQQGLVDWFVFWLKDEEDSAPEKAVQYARWRALRERTRELQRNSATPPPARQNN